MITSAVRCWNHSQNRFLNPALGFVSVEEILKSFPLHGPQPPLGNPALVTDDTQMTLAVGEALVEAVRPFTIATLEPPLRCAFVAWCDSPDNNRAPGNTCLNACANLASGLPWTKATVANSKGCVETYFSSGFRRF